MILGYWLSFNEFKNSQNLFLALIYESNWKSGK